MGTYTPEFMVYTPAFCCFFHVKMANYVPRKERGLHRHSGNIAAIDFGTTNCSIAYTTGSEVPCILTLNQTYYRIPTTILFKPDGAIDSFGYDARSEYLNLDDEERLEYAYFEQIKMNLQPDEVLIRYAPAPKGIKEGSLWVWFYRYLPKICPYPLLSTHPPL